MGIVTQIYRFWKKNFFLRNSIFCQKNNFHKYLRQLTVSVAFYGKFSVNWLWKVSNSELSGFDPDTWQVNIKRKMFASRWVVDFSSIFKYGHKIKFAESNGLLLWNATSFSQQLFSFFSKIDILTSRYADCARQIRPVSQTLNYFLVFFCIY